MDNGRRIDQDNDQQPEYHVNSGFVNKLRSKFAQLESSSGRIVLSKRSASVENLLTDTGHAASDYSSRFKNRRGSVSRSSNEDTNVSSIKTSNVILRKTAPQGNKRLERPSSVDGKDRIDRPRSNESLYKSADKMPVPRRKDVDFTKNHNARTNKPPLPKKNDMVSKRIVRNSSSDYPEIPKIEHHDWTIAPDLEKIGKDNIIIIESSTPAENEEKERALTKSHIDEVDSVFHHTKPLKDQKEVENELPKPHTVSAFRSFFEKTNKASDTLRAWQSHSPTRKSAGSDLGSPRVITPIASPRSAFEKVGEDNVFTLTTDTQSVTNRRSSSVEKSVVSRSSPQNSVGSSDIDSTPTSLEASRSVFQNDKQDEPSRNKGTPPLDNERLKVKAFEASSSHTLTPLNNVSEIFDSKAIKKEKLNRPKPVVLARKSKEFNVPNHISDNEVAKKNIPKDTIELKHEQEKRRHSSHEENKEKCENSITKVSIPENRANLTNDESRNHQSQNEDVLNESLVKPSMKKSGKTSPRKTKIFDSSNMVKRNRESPRSPRSPTQPPVQSALADKSGTTRNDTTEGTQKETAPVRPDRRQKPQSNKLPSSGLTQLDTKIIRNDTKSQADIKSPKANKPREPVSPKPKPPAPVEEAQAEEKRVPSKSADIGESPVSGMSSFLASRLKKSNNDNDSNQKTVSSPLLNGSSQSPVSKKRQAPSVPVENGFVSQSFDVEMSDKSNVKEQIPPPLPKTAEPTLPVSNIDDIMKRKKSSSQPSAKLVFDSSKIAKKRKDPPRRKPPRKTLQELNENITFDSPPVPKLDLSSITNEKQETEYQEGYIPTIIKPCNIEFIGECVVLEKSPYVKTKKAKVKIGFDDHATTTFEYEREESALENYLAEHPNEREEVERQEQDVSAGSQAIEELLNDSPRAPEPEVSALKPNLGIGASDKLGSYTPKMQTQGFQFGQNSEPEQEIYERRSNAYEDEDEQEEDDIQLVPADYLDLEGFSAGVSNTDIMF